MGQTIDGLFVEVIEAISAAAFLSPKEKLPYVRLAIKKLDTTKILLLILWEIKALDNEKYINLSLQVDEVGRILGGWSGQLIKRNSPDNSGEK